MPIAFFLPPSYGTGVQNSDNPFEKLSTILARLRAPDGCPWDREQTYKDINPYLLEEAHEVVEAINAGDFEGLKEELGDLLVHIFFHSQLASEEARFTAADVASAAIEKLIRRHPHVFGNTKANDTQAVLENWEKIKQKEKEAKGKKEESLLEGIPKSLPSLITAFRMGEKTSRVGFDWAEVKGILAKVREELEELENAIEKNDKKEIEKEYGDLLFTLANVGRFLKCDPETSLRVASRIFAKRFARMEKEAALNDRPLQALSPKEWDTLWKKIKAEN